MKFRPDSSDDTEGHGLKAGRIIRGKP